MRTTNAHAKLLPAIPKYLDNHYETEDAAWWSRRLSSPHCEDPTPKLQGRVGGSPVKAQTTS